MPCKPSLPLPNPKIPEPFSIGTPAVSAALPNPFCCRLPITIPKLEAFILPADPETIAAINAVLDGAHDVVLDWIDSLVPPCPREATPTQGT